MVGRVCRPKKESRIDVPVGLSLIAGLEGLTPLLSLFVPDTEDFTAAKTTLANEIPDVDPR
jgi:hypothetical protein